MTSQSPKRPRGLSPEDEILWAKVADSVRPLKKRRHKLTDAPEFRLDAPPPEPEIFIPEAQPRPPPPAMPLPRPKPPAPPPVLSHGETANIDRRTAERFIRGKMTIDGRLDLHGHGQEAAHIALNDFVQRHAARGSRALLIITGKGTRGEGILRKAVPHWLNDMPLRRLVLSFSHAQPRDGGVGALYVLLKRRRED